MGNDFNYHSAHKWMSNIDILIRYVNSRTGTRILEFDATIWLQQFVYVSYFGDIA